MYPRAVADRDDPELVQLRAINARIEVLSALRFDAEGREGDASRPLLTGSLERGGPSGAPALRSVGAAGFGGSGRGVVGCARRARGGDFRFGILRVVWKPRPCFAARRLVLGYVRSFRCTRAAGACRVDAVCSSER